MSDRSPIEWTDATWNPVTGCTKVSPGCDHCYAETFAERFRGVPGHHFERGFDVTLRPDKLDLPLRWRKPRRIFVNSMSDLFHQDVPDDFIAQTFAVMMMTAQHTYQLLTKRHGRMRALLSSDDFRTAVIGLADSMATSAATNWLLDRWPLPNVWLGVSVEDQRWADTRIPALLDTPAAVRWISAEPLLGPVDLTGWLDPPLLCDCGTAAAPRPGCQLACRQLAGDARLDWVVCGGESGHGARPMHPDWARGLRDQCTAAEVPFCFKQWGEHTPDPSTLESATRDAVEVDHGPGAEPGSDDPPAWMWRVGKHAAGRKLDGRTWDQYPPDAGAVSPVSAAGTGSVPA